MEIKEAKEKLERTSILWESSTKTDIVEAVKIAIEALEKQISKKPIKYRDTRQGFDSDGNSISRQVNCYKCPSCELHLGYVCDCRDEKYQDDYCRCCGQAIDWSD